MFMINESYSFYLFSAVRVEVIILYAFFTIKVKSGGVN